MSNHASRGAAQQTQVIVESFYGSPSSGVWVSGRLRHGPFAATELAVQTQHGWVKEARVCMLGCSVGYHNPHEGLLV